MLTPTQTVSLYRCLTEIRPDWDPSGCHSHVAQLAKDPREARFLALQAFTAAADKGNRTPQRILDQVRVEAQVRTLPPRHDDEPCPKCGSTTKRNDGTCNGCWQNERAANPRPASPVAALSRSAVPPPADFRDRVAAARTSVVVNVPGSNNQEGGK